MNRLLLGGFGLLMGTSTLLAGETAAVKWPEIAGSQRAANYEEALARAKESGKDIVVFQRGSDWNHLAEALYQSVWQKDELLRALGPGFVLVAVDKPEVLGGRAVQGQCTAVQCLITGLSDTPVGNSAPLHLAKLAEQSAPPNEITGLQSEGNAVYKPRADGALVADGTTNPNQDVLVLRLKTARGGRVLRLDFPTDAGLPGGGPGKADNGNFAISEIEAQQGSEVLKFAAAWGSATTANQGAWNVIDGISDKGDNIWNPAAHLHLRRTLLLTLAQPLKPGAEFTVRLICKSQYARHTPGCLRAAILPDDTIASEVKAVASAQLEAAKNAKFSWWDGTYCPRVALMDSQGRAIAAENKPRLGLTPLTLAARIKELRAVREKRDTLWAKAEKTEGPARAELLRQSLNLLGFANWQGNDNCYKFVHDNIRAADPKDESGAVRWLRFGGHGRDGAPGLDAVWKALGEKRYEDALAEVDRQLADPRNKALDNDLIQRIMLAKFHIYRQWPGHEEKRFDVQRAIAALDPTTYLGIGAVGFLGMLHRTPVPMMTYGWGPEQVKTGANVWEMRDTAYFFDHAGSYLLKITGSGDAVKIRDVAVLDGKTIVAQATPEAELQAKPLEVPLNLSSWREDRKYVLRLTLEAAEGKLKSTGRFEVEPLLPPAPSPKPVAKVQIVAAQTAPNAVAPTATTPAATWLTLEQATAWYQKIGDQLLNGTQGKENTAMLLAEEPLRTMLAKHEMLRVCASDTLVKLAGRPQGVAFLKEFFGDRDWLESFLTGGPSDRVQAIENLRFLYERGTELEVPVYRKLATAMALSVSEKHSRYRLLDRFEHIKRAHRAGLLHAAFDGHTVREMRWAIYLPGTARDYQFLLDDRQNTIGDYFGACWAIPYRDPNDYGYSVQGWGYSEPWTHFYGRGLGSRPLAAQRQLGGVCGTLSEYGASAAQAHGIMSTTVGQPGHCAYVIRVGDRWGIGNAVSGPHDTGFGAPGWDGTGYSTAAHLWEPVEADRERYLNAARLTWLARLQSDRAKAQVRIVPGLKTALFRGVGAQLPDFSKLTPEKTAVVNTFSLSEVGAPPANYGLTWDGFVEVSGNGPLKVSTHSDDGSRVLIDGQLVVAANCNKQEKTIAVAPGRHAVRVEYSQGSGAQILSVALDGVTPTGGWMNTYERAISAQPLNYGVWLEYLKALEATPDVPTEKWLALGRRAAKTFAPYAQAGWALVDRCFEKAAPTLKPVERVEFLMDCHNELRDDKEICRDYHYARNFNRHADLIGDSALAIDYFSRLLALHYSEDSKFRWFFNDTQNWGLERFAVKPATAIAHAQAVQAFFKAQGEGRDKTLVTAMVTGGLRKTATSDNLAGYSAWSEIAMQAITVQPQDVHLDAKQVESYPKIEPFPGELLSKGALLQVSSQSQYDRPHTYPLVTNGGAFGGWFDTNAEDKPWAQLQLPEAGELSGIVLVNRFDFPGEIDWAVPLKVSVSQDGKQWTEVASFDKTVPVFRVDLQGKKVRARFVRIERLPGKPQARFHFRNFLVYGTKGN